MHGFPAVRCGVAEFLEGWRVGRFWDGWACQLTQLMIRSAPDVLPPQRHISLEANVYMGFCVADKRQRFRITSATEGVSQRKFPRNAAATAGGYIVHGFRAIRCGVAAKRVLLGAAPA